MGKLENLPIHVEEHLATIARNLIFQAKSYPPPQNSSSMLNTMSVAL